MRLRLEQLSDHLLALYIAIDIWLFHKAPQIAEYFQHSHSHSQRTIT